MIKTKHRFYAPTLPWCDFCDAIAIFNFGFFGKTCNSQSCIDRARSREFARFETTAEREARAA